MFLENKEEREKFVTIAKEYLQTLLEKESINKGLYNLIMDIIVAQEFEISRLITENKYLSYHNNITIMLK